MSLLKTLGQVFLPVKWHLPKYLEVNQKLPDFDAPDKKRLTVDYMTRIPLEDLLHMELDSWQFSYMTNGYRALVAECFHSLIKTDYIETRFPMSKLHGYTNSKSCLVNNSKRSMKTTMSAMGSLIDDLTDLDGKCGEEILEACLAWRELRIQHGIKLYWDSWSKRYYWSNSGGSHHMAVLCYQLGLQNQEWVSEVAIERYTLNRDALRGLNGKVSVYVAMHKKHLFGYEYALRRLPRFLEHKQVTSQLGVTTTETHIRNFFSTYRFIFLDHGKEYSHLSESVLKQAEDNGFVMSLDHFLDCCEGIGDGADIQPIHDDIREFSWK